MQILISYLFKRTSLQKIWKVKKRYFRFSVHVKVQPSKETESCWKQLQIRSRHVILFLILLFASTFFTFPENRENTKDCSIVARLKYVSEQSIPMRQIKTRLLWPWMVLNNATYEQGKENLRLLFCQRIMLEDRILIVVGGHDRGFFNIAL